MKIAIPKEQCSSRPEAALLMWLLTRQSFGAEARLQAGFFNPFHIVLFADPNGTRFPFIEVFLASFSVESELCFRRKIIENASHQMSTQSCLTTL